MFIGGFLSSKLSMPLSTEVMLAHSLEIFTGKQPGRTPLLSGSWSQTLVSAVKSLGCKVTSPCGRLGDGWGEESPGSHAEAPHLENSIHVVPPWTYSALLTWEHAPQRDISQCLEIASVSRTGVGGGEKSCSLLVSNESRQASCTAQDSP